MMTRHCSKGLGAALVLLVCAAPAAAQAFRSSDLSRISSVGDVQLSPDGTHIAYTVQRNDRPGRPYSEVWIMEQDSMLVKFSWPRIDAEYLLTSYRSGSGAPPAGTDGSRRAP